jgi:benzoyl-CoA reductase/2-hydroxyglutaryl-CoA dehydratase subunit BcrC/BadD/HgdB
MNKSSALPRKEYLREQKQIYGRQLFGVFPAHYPREILWAMNALPVEIWDPPLKVSHANTHLQPHICSVVKLGLELILQGRCDDFDGFLFPHTCDSIQNLASIVHDYLGLDKHCYFFYHPKAPYWDSSIQYYNEQLRVLASRLEKQLGPLDPSELEERVRQGQEMASILRELYDLRARGELGVSNAEFYQVIRQGEYLHPDDFLTQLRRFLHDTKGPAKDGPPLILSGILPNPPELLNLLDRLGARVVEDDLLNCSRRLLALSSNAEDPFDALTESYFAMPPCTTKGSPLEERVNFLLGKTGHTSAKGVIFCMVKFCEPEFFDLPPLLEDLKKNGLATMVLESELNQDMSGQLTTRVEAFVEMIS